MHFQSDNIWWITRGSRIKKPFQLFGICYVLQGPDNTVRISLNKMVKKLLSKLVFYINFIKLI